MTAPDPCVDPAVERVNVVVNTMRDMFGNDICPPRGGGADEVFLVSGEGPAWDPLVEGCPDPFVWVRLVTRYRTENFPEPAMYVNCQGVAVIDLELGVGRCVSIEADVDWNVVADEALTGNSDAFLLDRVLCLIKGRLQNDQVAANPITPYGPDGGGIVWTTEVFIGITE